MKSKIKIPKFPAPIPRCIAHWCCVATGICYCVTTGARCSVATDARCGMAPGAHGRWYLLRHGQWCLSATAWPVASAVVWPLALAGGVASGNCGYSVLADSSYPSAATCLFSAPRDTSFNASHTGRQCAWTVSDLAMATGSA